MIDRARARELVARMRMGSLWDRLTSGFSAPQLAFYGDTSSPLLAAVCGRRAGKTMGGNSAFVARAATTPGGRFLYINETRAEAKRLAWYGTHGDGMASVLIKHGMAPGVATLNLTDLTIRFEAIDSWIYFLGADDEAAVRRALGGAYHEVWWDEAQKIPPRFTQTILETLIPTLLDYRGRLRLTGTPERKMTGLFYDVTRPEREKRRKGWATHHWTLLDNPFFGAVELRDGAWHVFLPNGDHAAGPFDTAEVAEHAAREVRYQRGVILLQELLGGPEAAPLDSPIMRRYAKGEWVAEGSMFTYAPLHQLTDADLCYAPVRLREDGFPDMEAAIRDLPISEPLYVVGVDFGFNDAFSIVVWAFSLADCDVLFEVCSWSRQGLTSDEQIAVVDGLTGSLPVVQRVADAPLGVVRGWSKGWLDRYPVAIKEAEKHHKPTFIRLYCNDISAGRLQFREGGELITQQREVQWSTVALAAGKEFEDPSIPNDVSDAGLYGHRDSYHHRFRADDTPKPGTEAYLLAQEQALEDASDMSEPDDYRGGH